MIKNIDTENRELILWDFVPLSDYQLPASPVAEAAQKGITFFTRLFRNKDPKPLSPIKSHCELQLISGHRLECLSPSPDWQSASRMLGERLSEWMKQRHSDPPILVLVAPPFSGIRTILSTLTSQKKWKSVIPPTPEMILADDDTWFPATGQSQKPWVFPCLEKSFLRHVSGLSVVRKFLYRAYSGDLGPGIICCDSWAWKYLSHVWRGYSPVSLTLQAFDILRLTRVFDKQNGPETQIPVTFRNSNDGHPIFEAAASSDADKLLISDFLQRLAVHSRGHLEIALTVWRSGLSEESGRLIEEKKSSERDDVLCQTIWMSDWDQIRHPEVPSDAGRDEAFVIHTLLIHNGLPIEWMKALVPLHASHVLEIVSKLQEAEIVKVVDGVCRIFPAGYPSARKFVQANGLLTDDF